MDMMGCSYEIGRSLARIERLHAAQQGDGAAGRWFAPPQGDGAMPAELASIDPTLLLTPPTGLTAGAATTPPPPPSPPPQRQFVATTRIKWPAFRPRRRPTLSA